MLRSIQGHAEYEHRLQQSSSTSCRLLIESVSVHQVQVLFDSSQYIWAQVFVLACVQGHADYEHRLQQEIHARVLKEQELQQLVRQHMSALQMPSHIHGKYTLTLKFWAVQLMPDVYNHNLDSTWCPWHGACRQGYWNSCASVMQAINKEMRTI